MIISKTDVEYAAALAKLEFSEEEKARYAKELSVVLDYMDQLGELDTEGVEPAYHVLPVTDVMREDVAVPSMDKGKVLSNAPDTRDGCFKVPRIIE